ncbi:heparan-alpha-glucosaminide N-acetyltransferase domain-containing protein [Solitalea sp. MAHUQ-68]|uniref:Heparan-alpha-glucosaminide N-acetyltransferase domain-containing protein n=1 Tax=Solitalea agri TaxID=2953739 RepID=A0A9X2F2B6_9SPHI|nr:heparan-alpha-glucosaminide N-acetyltransferase domain-containing protein [Solitalea agri]MCO4293307.1 heparan-alpha-glucosaminide N-acetyltransferase domain-containing protein [Solitalea agri]
MTVNAGVAKPRLLSLDFFRGITVAAMILVNNPGSWSHIYSPLEHAHWNGCTPTDLIFPFFLFIVGISIAYALSSQKELEDQSKAMKTITIRALKLFGLGLFLALYPKFDISTVRILGVLQRIGIVFFISAIIFLKAKPKTIAITAGGLLVLYYVLMNFVPVPGVGYANMEPETNLAAWLDRLVLTTDHTWKQSKTWDPEGVLSTMPAVATGLLGILCGMWMKKENDNGKKVAWLFVAGFGAAIAGLIWNFAFPINKSLWTSSFVLYTAGLGSIVFACCYWLIDVNGYKRFTKPFVAFGINAITAFFLSAFFVKTLGLIKVTDAKGSSENIVPHLYNEFVVPYFSPNNASLIHALIWVLLFTGIMMFMQRKKIIIKV